jgi:hypothetical protein
MLAIFCLKEKFCNLICLNDSDRNVAVSIPDGVIGFLIDLILSTTLWPWGRLIL